MIQSVAAVQEEVRPSRNGQASDFIVNYANSVQTFQTVMRAVGANELQAFRDGFYSGAREPKGSELPCAKIATDEGVAREVMAKLREMMKKGQLGAVTYSRKVYDGDGSSLYLYETGEGKTAWPIHFVQTAGNHWKIDSFDPHPLNLSFNNSHRF